MNEKQKKSKGKGSAETSFLAFIPCPEVHATRPQVGLERRLRACPSQKTFRKHGVIFSVISDNILRKFPEELSVEAPSTINVDFVDMHAE